MVGENPPQGQSAALQHANAEDFMADIASKDVALMDAVVAIWIWEKALSSCRLAAKLSLGPSAGPLDSAK